MRFARLTGLLTLGWLAVGSPATAEGSTATAVESSTERSGRSGPNESDKPRWITHRVVPGQSAASIAARYGITLEDLERWNPKVAGGRLRAGWILQLKTRGPVALPRPTLKTFHVVAPGDTWNSIASLHGTTADALQRRLGNGQTPEVGDRIVVWRDADAPSWNPYAGRARPVGPIPSVASGASSQGRPNDGSVSGSVALPQSSLYECWRPQNCYGSSHTVRNLVEAIARFRAAIDWQGTLLVKSISRHGGGLFPPHKSHQSGRDVDIQLPRLDGGDARGREDQIDWHATWTLVDALIETGQVEMIFLAGRLHPFLRRAARDMGASSAKVAKIGTIVRSWRGHHTHMHVRFRCGPGETECVGSRGPEDSEPEDGE